MTSPRGRRWPKVVAALGVASALVLLVLYASSDVDTALTEADRATIGELGLDAECDDVSDFAGQLRCVRAIQSAQLAQAPDLACVDEYGVTSHEPSAFLERGRGCCFDRSRLIEKAAAYFGLEARHVAIYNAHSWRDMVRGGTPSHSTSEVRTERGWMVVDSNSTALGLRTDGTPLDAPALAASLRDADPLLEPHEYRDYFEGEYRSIYGLYSRHGGFYPPFVRVPDVDWAQLAHNL
jgi:hypothetical protein